MPILNMASGLSCVYVLLASIALSLELVKVELLVTTIEYIREPKPTKNTLLD